MTQPEKTCFVIMPFSAELHYFYLYLEQYLLTHHGIKCERADSSVGTAPFLDKILRYIQHADFVIADCSGNNPNVLYELGVAHASGKQVVLLTKGTVADIPSDIRHYEFIVYDLAKHTEFLEKLDKALNNLFVERYDELYRRAQVIFTEFRQATNLRVTMSSKDVFVAQTKAAERTQTLPSVDEEVAIAEFTLPRIVAESQEVAVMGEIVAWISRKKAPPG
jgi:nucleoside 2-deoxyribosyltransferase